MTHAAERLQDRLGGMEEEADDLSRGSCLLTPEPIPKMEYNKGVPAASGALCCAVEREGFVWRTCLYRESRPGSIGTE